MPPVPELSFVIASDTGHRVLLVVQHPLPSFPSHLLPSPAKEGKRSKNTSCNLSPNLDARYGVRALWSSMHHDAPLPLELPVGMRLIRRFR